MADTGSMDPQRLLEQIEEEQASRGSGRSFMSLIVYVLLLGGIVAGLVYAHRFYQGEVAHAQFLHRRAELKLEYLSREAVVRQMEDDATYADERRALLKWYFKSIDDICADYYKYPTWCDPEARRLEVERNHKKGAINDGQKLEFERAYNLARIAYDTLRKGDFEIVATDGKMSTRLDFYRIGNDKVDGQDKLKADFFLTGVFGPLAYGNIDIEILNENKNMFAQLAGSGGPYLILQTPENQIENFPPGLAFGSYVLDLLPPLTKHLTMRFGYTATTFTGLPVKWQQEFIEIPVPTEWSADAETWMANVQKHMDPWEALEGGGEDEKPRTPIERLEDAVKEADRRAEEMKKEALKAEGEKYRARTKPKKAAQEDYFLGGAD